VEESRRAVVAALAGNLALAVLKGVSAAATGSAAMLAETFHSIADTGNQVLLFVGLRLGRRPPHPAHPFGHGMNVYFWSFLVSVMLFTLGGAFSIREGVHKLLESSPHIASKWAFVVLGGAFVFESLSMTVALRALRRARGSTPLREYWRSSRDPTLLTVVLEDLSALLSIGLAAGGLGLNLLTGDPVWDALASTAIGAILIGVALVLALESYSLLLGESAPRDVLGRIRTTVGADAAVSELVGLRTMHLGPTALLVILAVAFRDELSAPELEHASARLRRTVAAAVGESGDPQLVVIDPRPAPSTSRTAAA
jgi:cation diffusion facilitator family transporter